MNFSANTNKDKGCRTFCSLFFLLALVLVSAKVSASGDDLPAESKKFNPGEMIMHHIQDAHSIHFFGDVTIPLPCIVKTENGWDFFMSSVFMDEHHEFNNTYTSARTGNSYVLHHEKIEIIKGEHDHSTTEDYHPAEHSATAPHNTAEPGAHADPADHQLATTSILDLSITKSVLGMLLILSAVIYLFVRLARSYQKKRNQAPRGLNNLLELLVVFIRDDVATPALGKKRARKFLPFLLTMFFFIWICNLLGLVPFAGGFNITGTISITIVMATLVFVITTFSGNKHYWGHIVWPPGIPLGVKIILVPIEIASIFIKPIVLMIRLTANINAGHIVILALTSLVFIFGQNSATTGYSVGVASTLFMVFMFLIELLVAFLQAYVFTLLTAIYFGDATQEHHHAPEVAGQAEHH
ncbi:MAG: F0F1 ATP synthase subunit A [Flavobacteriales bacterium]|nr:F0F1 ATP synthase subunit A [Flavobacteriales bacterium]